MLGVQYEDTEIDLIEDKTNFDSGSVACIWNPFSIVPVVR